MLAGVNPLIIRVLKVSSILIGDSKNSRGDYENPNLFVKDICQKLFYYTL